MVEGNHLGSYGLARAVVREGVMALRKRRMGNRPALDNRLFVTKEVGGLLQGHTQALECLLDASNLLDGRTGSCKL